MNPALTFQKYLGLNQGKYKSNIVELPQIGSAVFLTNHDEVAFTDLLHYHPEAHLSFILNGSVIDKRKSHEELRTSCEIMYFNAGEPHQTIFHGLPVRNINIELKSDYFRKNNLDESNINSHFVNSSEAKFSMLKIYKELLVGDEFSSSSIELLLLNVTNSPNSEKKKHPLWLTKIVELLHDNWNQEITVSDLSNAVQIHPKTISKYFPRYFYCTLGEYRRRLKIEKCFSLIKNSNLSLTEIAFQCGFYDQSHFNSVFKMFTGFRPKEFKKL